MKLFVDDERPAPKGWQLAETVEDAQMLISLHAVAKIDPFEALSLDHDLGYRDTIMPLLIWIRDASLWPLDLYVHTANEDGEEAMLGFIRQWAPSGTLKGWGCNFWGTGPDSAIRNEVVRVDGAEA